MKLYEVKTLSASEMMIAEALSLNIDDIRERLTRDLDGVVTRFSDALQKWAHLELAASSSKYSRDALRKVVANPESAIRQMASAVFSNKQQKKPPRYDNAHVVARNMQVTDYD